MLTSFAARLNGRSYRTLRPGGGGAPEHRALPTSNGPLGEVLFAHKGATILTAAEGGTVTLWDAGQALGWEQVTAAAVPR